MEDTKKSIKIFNRDMMKYMALIPMAVGHAVAWINLMHYPDDSEALYRLSLPLLIITGLAMFCPPVMFFFITDGYKYTRDRKKYAERLLVFALITQPFDWLVDIKCHIHTVLRAAGHNGLGEPLQTMAEGTAGDTVRRRHSSAPC